MIASEGLAVQTAARVLKVSESGFYEWKRRPSSARSIRHAWLTDMIRQVHTASRGTYGANRVHAELTMGYGITVGHNAVAMLMQRAALQGLPGNRRPHRRVVPEYLEVTRFDRLYVVWYMALMTGMRRGEVLGLRWRDCDLEAGRMRLVRQLRVVRHVPEFSDLKTDRSRRQVGLDPRTATLLRQHRTTQIEERLMVGDGYQDGDLVFATPDGAHYHPEAVSKVFDRRVARWGMPHITFHDTRHTWATLALQAGVHPKVVSDRLGHASVAFTLDVYTHAIQGLDDDAAARVAELVHRGTRVRPGS